MIRILSPVTSVTPSMTSPFSNPVARVKLAVVAARTDALTSSPVAVAST